MQLSGCYTQKTPGADVNCHSVDTPFSRLHLAGWTVGETGTGGAWIVDGAKGENRFVVFGRTQAEAWASACRQAESLGMLGLTFY